jgi:hypothetical protein
VESIVIHSITIEHTMQRTAIWIPTATAVGAPPRWRAWLRRAWALLTMDGDERFLAEARDFADLEQRLRRLERGRARRFAPLPPGL